MDQKQGQLITMHKAFQYPRGDIDYECQEKKEEENSPALKIPSMHQ